MKEELEANKDKNFGPLRRTDIQTNKTKLLFEKCAKTLLYLRYRNLSCFKN
jgi:hypothetical protein